MSKSYPIERMAIKYRTYDIEFNLYGMKEYSVQYCGDEFCFETEKEAEIFIDSLDK